MSGLLAIDHVDLAYDTHKGLHPVVADFSLQVERGDIACLLGSSGCGKSTLLRAIAGFEPVRAGSITLNGKVIATPQQQVQPELRQVGMMFQDYALFPHLTVGENVGFGLRRLSRDRQQARIAEMLALVDLIHAKDHYPHELSGGQQQRIALARALAPSPELLLLDEPFANLDVDMRERLAFELRDMLKSAGFTAILVTHNQAEAFAIADKIGVMSKGTLLQWDTPSHLLAAPADAFVAGFIRQEALAQQRLAAYMR
jgi:iron(III) transport system ATP-binding protein